MTLNPTKYSENEQAFRNINGIDNEYDDNNNQVVLPPEASSPGLKVEVNLVNYKDSGDQYKSQE